MQGVSAGLVGSWQLKVGPRKAMAAAAVAFGGGLVIGSAGIYLHSLPLLYLGYGFLGGTGLNLPVGISSKFSIDNELEFSHLNLLGCYCIIISLGIGLAYTPPVQTLMQWFPDKKGIASGLTIAGFGSGALFFTPAVQYLMHRFAKLPEYVGTVDKFVTTFTDGKLFADVNGKLVEVVIAGPAELAKLSTSGLSEGLYVVGKFSLDLFFTSI